MKKKDLIKFTEKCDTVLCWTQLTPTHGKYLKIDKDNFLDKLKTDTSTFTENDEVFAEYNKINNTILV